MTNQLLKSEKQVQRIHEKQTQYVQEQHIYVDIFG